MNNSPHTVSACSRRWQMSTYPRIMDTRDDVGLT